MQNDTGSGFICDFEVNSVWCAALGFYGHNPEFISAILSIVYNSTPESETGLRETILWKGLVNHFWLQNDNEVLPICQDNVSFAVELLKQASNSHVTTKKARKRAAAE